MSVISLNKDNFQEKVLNNEGVVLVDFYADWCGPCKMMAPVVEAVSNEMSDITVGKVNTDESPSLAEEYSIFSIPTLMIFKDGVVVDKQIGACIKDELVAKINAAK